MSYARYTLARSMDKQAIHDELAEMALTVVRRTYTVHGSVDQEDFSTDEERKLLNALYEGIFYSLRSGIRTTLEVQAFLTMAEYTWLSYFPDVEGNHVNTYDTIYRRMFRFWEKHREEEP